jgi:CubicO group peptidase (beta-lactamase class C family)
MEGGYWLGPHDEAFGHSGLGGSLAFADPVAGLGYAFVTSKMLEGRATDERARALIEAAYEVVR